MGAFGEEEHEVGVHWFDNSIALCLLGGLALGALSAARMFIFGKVTGISGLVQAAFVFDSKYVKEHGWLDDRRLFSAVFLIGVMVAGVIDRALIGDCFQDWGVLPTERLVLGGILVGFGTKMGNGCTSGHGVCGISSLRFRSLVATCTFMLFAIATALATDTYSYLPRFRNTINLTTGYAMVLVVLGVCAALALLAYVLRTHFADFVTSKSTTFKAYVVTQELIFGLCFGVAMGVSNMTRLSAVISFLDLRYWNPALAFVMGGAITVAAPLFFLTLRSDCPCLDMQFHLSKLTQADKSLIAGAAIFGVGWGLFGACPGPALANIGSGNSLPIAYVFCILLGMYVEHWMSLLFKANFPAKVDSATPCECEKAREGEEDPENGQTKS